MRSAEPFEPVAFFGLIAVAGGVALLGLAALQPGISARLAGPMLLLGVLVAVSTHWFWLFILNRSYPQAVIIIVWMTLGIGTGICWGYLGQLLITDARQMSSSPRGQDGGTTVRTQ
jgi:hypothetical protein